MNNPTSKTDLAAVVSFEGSVEKLRSCLEALKSWVPEIVVVLGENENSAKDSTIVDIGELLLGKYLLPFEVVSILLLAALIGAAMLSRKKAE